MCDEYDDERMWTFWRRLEINEELKRQEQEPQETERPLTIALPEAHEAPKPRPRTLTH